MNDEVQTCPMCKKAPMVMRWEDEPACVTCACLLPMSIDRWNALPRGTPSPDVAALLREAADYCIEADSWRKHDNDDRACGGGERIPYTTDPVDCAARLRRAAGGDRILMDNGGSMNLPAAGGET